MKNIIFIICIANIFKKSLNYIRKPSLTITLSIGTNRITIQAVAFEFIAHRRTDDGFIIYSVKTKFKKLKDKEMQYAKTFEQYKPMKIV